MLDVKFVRDNMELVRRMLANRQSSLDLEPLLKLDETRRNLLVDVEEKKHRRNVASEEISRLKKEKKDAAGLVEEMKALGAQIKSIDLRLGQVEQEFMEFLLAIPNVPHDSVPVGSGEKDNVQVRTWGQKPVYDFQARPHWEIGEDLGILDFERGAKIAGARFTLYWGAGSALERALYCFMLDMHTRRHGYTEVLPPFIVNSASMRGTGQLPKFKEDLFKLEGWDYWLIPTAEVPVTNIHSGEILDESVLPLNYTAYTPCFRSEAGSHGKDTRGLIRQHQFQKVELVKFTKPQDSYEQLENLLGNAEAILRELGIHYRVVLLCTGDMGFSSAKTYDIEVWLPGQNTYREISSCSNFEDFQARRANIRYRPKGGNRTQLVHTLNGSGLAVGRTLVAVLENFQQEDGSVVIPEVLRPYMGNLKVIQRGVAS
jgi:seryl-tRNA synthetase